MERRRIGTVEVIALIDTVQTYPATAVYPGAKLDRFAGYFDANGGITLNFACFLVIDGDQRILVDTGWGPEYEGRMPAELRAAGVDPSTVNVVTYSHLHGDHTAWNVDRASGAPFFPNARYLVPKGDWNYYAAQDPPPESFTRDMAPLEALKRMDLIEGEAVISQSMTALPTPGHTPGHTSFIIRSGGGLGCILGDVVLTHVDAEDPSLDTAFDTDHALARKTREMMIARLATDGSLVGASHLPVPGFGRFVVEGSRSRWVAA